ncbi:MAG: type IV pilus biogenesis protein PilM, partial [Gemmataceae bacterium]
MPRFLALDWDQKYVRVVEATLGGGSVHIQRAAVWPVEQTPAASQAEEQGRWLKDLLKQAGIAPAPLLVALGRDRVILKDIRYPEVAETEEASVVRFQAARELTDAPEDLVIDYCPMGEGGGSGQKRALVVVGRRDLIGAYQTIAKTAGLKLAAITPRSFGLVACLNRLAGTSVLTPAYAAGEAAAVVSLSETWAEFCILQQEKLVYSRFLPVSDALAGEIRRNLLVYAGQAPQHPLRSVYVAGDQAELMAQLQTTPSIAFHRLDPFGGDESTALPSQGRGAFAGVIGLLHAQAGKTPLPVNLVQPHQYQSSKPTPKRRLIFAGALAVTVLLGGLGVC